MEPTRAIAFFDVDETLISVKSMFDFYAFFLADLGLSQAEQQRRFDDAKALTRSGLPREEGNRLFYRRFAGYRQADVAAAGRRWFDAWLRRGGLFHTDVVEVLRAHRRAGTMTVLLSGSFDACLDPVREHVGADRAESTGLEVKDGVYTGEVTRTMIGDAKADAAAAWIRRTAVDPAECFAYGDHVSDLGLLALVGHPGFVGEHPEVVAAAGPHWRRFAGVPEVRHTA